jgi:hypothetical protein
MSVWMQARAVTRGVIWRQVISQQPDFNVAFKAAVSRARLSVFPKVRTGMNAGRRPIETGVP